MEANLQNLLEEIRHLERSVAAKINKKKVDRYKNHRKSILSYLFEASFLAYVVAPITYSMLIPAMIMDVFITVYQMICFPVYGISKLKRSDYIVFDRGRLKYLNWIERTNCDYCSYFNGLIAYAREIASRTEQYFCPIRHALKIKGLHARHASFLSYGETDNFRQRFEQLSREIREAKKEV